MFVPHRKHNTSPLCSQELWPLDHRGGRCLHIFINQNLREAIKQVNLIIGLCILLRVYQLIYVETSVRNKCQCSFYCALLTLHVSAPIGGHLQVVFNIKNSKALTVYVNGSVALKLIRLRHLPLYVLKQRMLKQVKFGSDTMNSLPQKLNALFCLPDVTALHYPWSFRVEWLPIVDWKRTRSASFYPDTCPKEAKLHREAVSTVSV
jgi:hypothetical protein